MSIIVNDAHGFVGTIDGSDVFFFAHKAATVRLEEWVADGDVEVEFPSLIRDLAVPDGPKVAIVLGLEFS